MTLDERARQAIYDAVVHKSPLSSDILALPGMSSDKVRHFLCNLCAFSQCRYLEVGTWQGSTLLSSMSTQSAECYWVIDNWSEWGQTVPGQPSIREQFMQHYARHMAYPGSKWPEPRIIEQDFKSVSFLPGNSHSISSVNVFFYDGAHDETSQYQALEKALPAMADPFVFIVDDWNHEPARVGTERAISDLGLHAIYHAALPANGNADRELWWNGLGVYVLHRY